MPLAMEGGAFYMIIKSALDSLFTVIAETSLPSMNRSRETILQNLNYRFNDPLKGNGI